MTEPVEEFLSQWAGAECAGDTRKLETLLPVAGPPGAAPIPGPAAVLASGQSA
jgi:hypothetical protein